MGGRQDHFSSISERAKSESDVLAKIAATGKVLGFDICHDAMLARGPQLWRHAQEFGLCLDGAWPTCAHPSLRCALLLIVDASDSNSDSEQKKSEIRMRWLACVAHLALDRQLVVRNSPSHQSPLTERELDVLRWTAHGKTSSDISQLLSLSEHTVNFHIRNVITKLHTTNKTAAAVRAALLGWL